MVILADFVPPGSVQTTCIPVWPIFDRASNPLRIKLWLYQTTGPWLTRLTLPFSWITWIS